MNEEQKVRTYSEKIDFNPSAWKSINRESILSVSMADYCNNVGKDTKEYYMVGVTGVSSSLKVPEATEVVVDYRPIDHQIGYGTALIPIDYDDW